MAVLTLPVRSDFDRFAFQVDLQGTLYNLAFRWNDRAGAWFFTLADADGDPIVAGKRVSVDVPLLRNVTDARRPAGEILALDTNGAGDPAQSDLGGRVVVVYVEG